MKCDVVLREYAGIGATGSAGVARIVGTFTSIIPIFQKRPRPKTNEVCWGSQRDWCTLGYDCPFIHEDLEYDPVSTLCGTLNNYD